MKRIGTIISLCILGSAAVAAAEGEGKALFSQDTAGMFAKGTMQVGGSVGFRVDAWDPDRGNSDIEGVVIHLSPTFGYFALDNLELTVLLSLQIPTGDLYEDQQFTLNVMGGVRYIIPLGRLAPHFGFMFGGGGMWNSGPDMKFISLQVPAGLLVPLNEHVAVDFGFKLNVVMLLDGNDYLGSLISMPVGYLGIEGFF